MAPVEINFLLLSSVFSLLTTIYLTLAALNKLPAIASNRFALLAADAVTMMFWFGGFVALAVFLSSRVCFSNVCNVAKASVAFGALNWYVVATKCDPVCLSADSCYRLLFAGTTAWAGVYTFKARRIQPPPKNFEMNDAS